MKYEYRKTYRAVIARFPTHLPFDDGVHEWEGYDYTGPICSRCLEPLYEDEDAAPWAGSSNGPFVTDECLIIGEFEAPHVLVHIKADTEWLKEHADELRPFTRAERYQKERGA